ncbi:MAG: error-prone DNA polymerase [Gemmatimonadetes bacterium]|nr:error-prone DNA polymerase [Gemmatimonadota bacterium]
MSYVELRAHSAFSFGDGASTPEALVARAAELGYTALGLTDHADLGGVIRFALEAERRGVKPVVGAELLVDGCPAAFLARDEEGYRNLAGLVTRARVGELRVWQGEGQGLGEGEAEAAGAKGRGQGEGEGRGAPPRGRPSLTFQDIAERSAGLIALTGPAAGEIASLIRAERPEEAAFMLARWGEVFAGRLAVEVQLHHVSGAESALAWALIELAERGGVPWVAANDPRYLDAGGRLVHDLFTALRAGVCVNTAASWGLLHPNGEWRLKSPPEMAALWQGRERGLEESCRLAGECRAFDLRWLRPPLPRFPVPPGHACPERSRGDDDSYLRELVYAGARQRWGELDERQRAQLEHELGVIRRLGFAGFFLVMWDAVRFARSRDILCQGRGSAANSAVAYCLGITAVDPVRHGLLFERFLSEVRTDGRTEAPDIDVDFEMHRREEVLDYMYQTYRRQHAAITCVTQTFHAPSAVQDVMRALGYPAELAFRLSKRMHGHAPSAGAEMLEKGLAAEAGLELGDARGRALVAAMKALDDLPRLRSTHPGGFVLSCRPLGEYLPIEHTTMGRTILQFDKDDLDAAGVPKFDFLGLGGLSAVHLAFDAIEKRTGEKLELYRLPVDDRATFEMIARGDTVGTFQIESRAQIQSILQTWPERLYDLVVQVALIRPGPIQARFVRPYTRRRRGLEPVRCAHPLLEPILRRTYGIPIFQEQAMAVAMALGGFSAAEADELRRAMGHQRKLPRLHAALERLRSRIIERGIDPAVAAGVVEDLHSFANYGFPESHAWSFALIAYATAYLKAHYPAEFCLGLLNAWPMGFYPPATLVHDARRHGVTVLPPCLKRGGWDCTLEFVPVPEERPGTGVAAAPPGTGAGTRTSPALRIGRRHIRGRGEKAREALQSARAAGPFTSVEDVVRRARLTRADALHLARAGAFEAFEPGRRKAAWAALRAAGDLLPLAPARHLPFDPRELEGEELVFLDYLATGICTHGHPMEHLRERLRAAGVTASQELEQLVDGERVVVAGLVVARQHPETARGTVFVLLEDEFGFINVIVPARTYQRHREVVHFAPFLVVEGSFEREDRAINVVGRRFRELTAREITFQSRDFR